MNRNCELEILKKYQSESGAFTGIEVGNKEYKNLKIYMKWDGCVDIVKYYNGSTYEDEYVEGVTDVDSIHICDVKQFIAQLQQIVNIAEKNFDTSDFKEYWE